MSVYGGLNELDFWGCAALELGGNLLKQFPLEIFSFYSVYRQPALGFYSRRRTLPSLVLHLSFSPPLSSFHLAEISIPPKPISPESLKRWKDKEKKGDKREKCSVTTLPLWDCPWKSLGMREMGERIREREGYRKEVFKWGTGNRCGASYLTHTNTGERTHTHTHTHTNTKPSEVWNVVRPLHIFAPVLSWRHSSLLAFSVIHSQSLPP